jgi:DNA-binding NtrC family response regulator
MSNSVLVVEDHHELLTLIEQRLTQRGYDVRCAATIHDAVATLNEMHSTCLVLWDPTTLPMSGPLVALAGRLGVHIATIPVGITSRGQTDDGSPIITKRLTSVDAMLTVLREHCSGAEDLAAL